MLADRVRMGGAGMEREIEYVLATDDDFSGTSNGQFSYIGTDKYVEIPHVIKGVNVTSYANMFNGTSVKGVVSTNKNVTDMSYMFQVSKATSLDLSNFDTSNVTSMSWMFNASQATNLDLSSFDTSNVVVMSNMFWGSQATSLDLSSFNTSSVANMADMFRASQVTSLDLSNFDTSNVTNMSNMFYYSQATLLDLSSFNTSSVIYIGNMFYGSQATIGYARTQADADKFNSSSGKPIGLTFIEKYALATDDDFSGTSNGQFRYIGNYPFVKIPHVIKGINVTSYADMFRDTSVKGVKSTNKNVVNMSNMFRGSQATSLDLSNFDTSSVTDMRYMFQNSQATSLDLSSFDTSSVTTMINMFRESQAIHLDLSNFDTSSVTYMGSMFQNSQATSLDLSSFDTSNVLNMNWMFYDSKATIGYARTQADADKLNSSLYKPAGLTFVVKP